MFISPSVRNVSVTNGIVEVKFRMFIDTRFLVFLATILQTKPYAIDKNRNFFSYIKGHHNLNPCDLMLNVHLIITELGLLRTYLLTYFMEQSPS